MDVVGRPLASGATATGVARGAVLASVGAAVPERVVGNAAIAARLGIDEEWIVRRTGTVERHEMAADERLDELAARAARVALERAGVDPGDVDLVLVGTSSAEEMSPHAAPLVAADIGAHGAGAVDLSAACTGFLSGLALGTAQIEAGRAGHVLVVGADALTQYLDRDDRGSAMLFGDGAGAVVLSAAEGPSQVGPVLLASDGRERALIRLDREERLIRMDGPTVYKHAVRLMSEVTLQATAAAGVTLDEIDLFVYHQANSRIIDAVGRRLGLDPDRVVDVVGRFANTSAATLPIALDAAAEDGRLVPGATVLLAAFGAGLVWGGGVVRWGGGRAGPTGGPPLPADAS